MKENQEGEKFKLIFPIEEIDFLRESNAIESVFDKDSLFQALHAWQYIKNETILSTNKILQTHKTLMLNSSLFADEKGEFRKRPVYVGNKQRGYFEKLNWEKIPSAIDNWIVKMNSTIGIKENLEDLNKDLHVEYEEIHPFIDGNGRTGRIFMNWWRLRNQLPVLVIKNEEKQTYYSWFNK